MKLHLFLFLIMFTSVLPAQAPGASDELTTSFSLESVLPYAPPRKISKQDLLQEDFKAHGPKDKRLVFNKKIYHMLYHFDLEILYNESLQEITSFYLMLPRYFQHDVLHQSLIETFGKQDQYFLENEHAVYRWNRDEHTVIYEAACTITCFPIYLKITSSN